MSYSNFHAYSAIMKLSSIVCIKHIVFVCLVKIFFAFLAFKGFTCAELINMRLIRHLTWEYFGFLWLTLEWAGSLQANWPHTVVFVMLSSSFVGESRGTFFQVANELALFKEVSDLSWDNTCFELFAAKWTSCYFHFPTVYAFTAEVSFAFVTADNFTATWRNVYHTEANATFEVLYNPLVWFNCLLEAEPWLEGLLQLFLCLCPCKVCLSNRFTDFCHKLFQFSVWTDLTCLQLQHLPVNDVSLLPFLFFLSFLLSLSLSFLSFLLVFLCFSWLFHWLIGILFFLLLLFHLSVFFLILLFHLPVSAVKPDDFELDFGLIFHFFIFCLRFVFCLLFKFVFV